MDYVTRIHISIFSMGHGYIQVPTTCVTGHVHMCKVCIQGCVHMCNVYIQRCLGVCTGVMCIYKVLTHVHIQVSRTCDRSWAQV